MTGGVWKTRELHDIPGIGAYLVQNGYLAELTEEVNPEADPSFGLIIGFQGNQVQRFWGIRGLEPISPVVWGILGIWDGHYSGQISATSHDLSAKDSFLEGKWDPLFQEKI